MGELHKKKHEPESGLAHDLLNKLSLIIGHCDLLEEQRPADPPLLRHLRIVRDAAQAVSKELILHQRDFRSHAHHGEFRTEKPQSRDLKPAT